MKRFIKPVSSLILFDIKKLILTEVIIKLIGFLIIYPLFRIGFYYSLEFSGLNYIGNNQLKIFLTKPSTIIIAFFLILLFGIYLLLEYTFITLLLDYAKKRENISYKDFFLKGILKYLYVLKRYHLFILIPILLFFVIFEFAQVFIFSSSINLPDSILVDFKSLHIPIEVVFTIYFFILWIFIELIFFTHTLVLSSSSMKTGFRVSRKVLYKRRIKTFLKILFLNIILNLILLLVYALILFVVSQFISIIHGSNVIFGIIITSMYSIYWIIGIIFSAIVIPLNIAVISNIYYKTNKPIKQISKKNMNTNNHNNRKWIITGFTLGFILVFALNIASITSSILQTGNQFQILKQEEIIAHRGASMDAPENTLAALDLAIIQGADAVEFDIKGTKDNIPILLHDDTMIRTTDFDVKLNIKDINYETVQNYEAGGWFSEAYYGEKIPTLEEAFELIAGRTTAFMDMKTTNRFVEAEVVRLIEVYGMEKHVKIMSFDLNQLSRFKELNPNLQTILLVSEFFGQIDILFTNDNVDHFALRISIIERDSSIVRRIQKQGKKVYAWTVDTENQIYIGVRADVDGFITKRPIEAREIAHSKSSNEDFREILERLFKP